MPIESPAGALPTLEETVALARGQPSFEGRFTSPVLLVVAPFEDWAESTQGRQTLPGTGVSVQMLPTLVVALPALQGAEITFGRGTNNSLVMPFAAMSKSHGFFRFNEALWQVGDVGSKNGTYVDGQRVGNGVLMPLRDGASLRFGDVTARFLSPVAFCADLRRRLV